MNIVKLRLKYKKRKTEKSEYLLREWVESKII